MSVLDLLDRLHVPLYVMFFTGVVPFKDSGGIIKEITCDHQNLLSHTRRL